MPASSRRASRSARIRSVVQIAAVSPSSLAFPGPGGAGKVRGRVVHRGEQAVPECRSLRTGGDAELLPQRPVQAVELAQGGVPASRCLPLPFPQDRLRAVSSRYSHSITVFPEPRS